MDYILVYGLYSLWYMDDEGMMMVVGIFHWLMLLWVIVASN